MFRSFHQRVLILVIGLVFAAQLSFFGAVLAAIDQDVKASTRENLQTAGAQAMRLIDARAKLLHSGAVVLAADYGFKSAIASGDVDTIRSALVNSIERIGADTASLISSAGIVSTDQALSSTSPTSNVDTESDAAVYAQLAREAGRSGSVLASKVLGGEVRQIVMVPVKAPIVVGWLVLGFALDESFAYSLKRQIGMDMSFTSQSGSQVFSSTLENAQRRALPVALTGMFEHATEPSRDIVLLANEQFLTHRVALDKASQGIALHVQRSLDQALAGYRDLRARLVILVAFSLMLAIVLAKGLARGVSRPVSVLLEAVARVGRGDYQTPVQLERRDEFGQLAQGFQRMQHDIANREARIVHQALHDELTGLPNLRLAQDRLEQLIQLGQRKTQSVAVVLIAVDRYQRVVETLGHDTGEHLLKVLASRLEMRARRSDTIARSSVDEFLILMGDAREAQARTFLAELLPQLMQPISLDAAELQPDFSVGIAVVPEHASTPSDALRRASIALGDARERQDGVGVYVNGRDKNHRRQLAIIADLQRAVDDDELLIHYQPKIDMVDGQVRSVEALVRWIHPEHGFMPPDEFIGLAENSGNISLLTDWVLKTVIRQLADWSGDGIRIRAGVNLSALDLQDASLESRIERLLGESRVCPTSLILEVTESAMMRDTEQALEILGRLRQSGMAISLDDFGTGYSSLAKLRDLPIDELKIDRAFVQDIKPDTTEAHIIEAIIRLGHSVGLKTVTEGVETEDEWKLLAELGNDVVQGYYVAKPMPAADFTHWWAAHAVDTSRQAGGHTLAESNRAA